MNKYAIGLDFGTLSARAVLIDINTGKVILNSVYGYPDAVIDTMLPGTDIRLPADFALQNPMDYKDSTEGLLRDILKSSQVAPEDIVSIGVDFTACTLVAVDELMWPLCLSNKYADNPHSWVKLWKHHGAQREADEITRLARRRGEKFISRYGNSSSSEWLFAKILETYHQAPEIYAATYKFMEAGDWVVWLLTGNVSSSNCMAGYKAFWSEEDGYPSQDFFQALEPGLKHLREKLVSNVSPVGTRAGGLTREMAKATGLKEGTSVAVCMIDAHAAVPVAGVSGDNSLLMSMGTSLCHIFLSRREILIDGICGVVKNGVIPGYYGYEAGQAAVGDIYDWFITNFASNECFERADEAGISPFDEMEKSAALLAPGESGLLALDWWNGNRSMLNNASLSGLLMGMTLSTKPAEVYRALIEGTAYGTRSIIEAMQRQGVLVEHIYACGGLSRKSQLVMQVFADVLGRDITVTPIVQSTAYGAAIYGMVAAGTQRGGFDSLQSASEALVRNQAKIFHFNAANHQIYSRIFQHYQRLTGFFGQEHTEIMQDLKEIKSLAAKE